MKNHEILLTLQLQGKIKSLEAKIVDLKKEVSHLIRYGCTRKQSSALKSAREQLSKLTKVDWDSLVNDYENGSLNLTEPIIDLHDCEEPYIDLTKERGCSGTIKIKWDDDEDGVKLFDIIPDEKFTPLMLEAINVLPDEYLRANDIISMDWEDLYLLIRNYKEKEFHDYITYLCKVECK